MTKSERSRESILEAAEIVAAAAGPGHLSLDMVAHEAGMSKGGLMHHFPTKELLLKAMLERLIGLFFEDREKKMRTVAPGPGQLLKSGIQACMDRPAARDRTALALLAVAAYAPNLLAPMREVKRRHLEELKESDLDYYRATVISLAADGLFLHEILGISPYDAAQRQRIKEEMMRMIDACALTGKKKR